MQNFTIRLVPADGSPVPPINGRADAECIREAFLGIRDGMLVIRTEGGGFVSVQAGAIVSFVSMPAPTLETLCAGAPVHSSDCAVHNAPAALPGPCDCGAEG